MKKSLDAFYTYKEDKYSKNRKDYYFRCLIEFFVRHTYLTPKKLIGELEKQYVKNKEEDQSFFIDGKEYRIRLEKLLPTTPLRYCSATTKNK